MVKFRILLAGFVACAVFLCYIYCDASHGAEKKKIKWVKSKTGLKSLMTLSKDRGKMVKEFKSESKNFDKVKSAIEAGGLKKGETARDVHRRYGDPVIVLSEDGGQGMTRWVYKPYQTTYFKGEKAYLYFDAEGTLIDWRLLDQEGKGLFSGLLGG